MSLKHFIKTQVLSSYNKERIIFLIGVVSIFFSSIISVFAANYLYSSSEVSFDNSSSGISSDNVQGAIDELYQNASDYSSLESRIGALEGHWYDDDRYLVVKSTGANNSGLILRDATDTNKGSFQYNHNGYSILESRDSTGTLGKGELQIKGKPITLDATTGGTGDINLNGNVKVNGNLVSNIIYARSSSANLNTIYSNQPNDSVYLISGQGEINLPVSGSTAIHMVISYKATNTYGYQYCFLGTTIYFRSISAGTWGSWSKIVG
ncbi:MAG: hypothetical protein IJ105_00180 [Bacilli bacterium]|nr:hypothetical protein [Bacilli bacterium]